MYAKNQGCFNTICVIIQFLTKVRYARLTITHHKMDDFCCLRTILEGLSVHPVHANCTIFLHRLLYYSLVLWLTYILPAHICIAKKDDFYSFWTIFGMVIWGPGACKNRLLSSQFYIPVLSFSSILHTPRLQTQPNYYLHWFRIRAALEFGGIGYCLNFEDRHQKCLFLCSFPLLLVLRGLDWYQRVHK